MTNQVQKKRFSDEELEEFKSLIINKLSDTRQQLDFCLNQLKNFSQSDDAKIKGLDNGMNTIESEQLTNMATRHKRHINHLENALLRIKNKVYGVCRESGVLISKERLKIVPHATLSIIEKKKIRRR